MELAPSQKLEHLVADAGFDSAYNHALLREYHGIRSTIPPEAGRPSKDPSALPTDKYRRLMKIRFNTKAYRKRPQVETVISMLKRNFGSSLRGKSHWSRCRDMYLRVLTHNIALALLWVFYRADGRRFQVEQLPARADPQYRSRFTMGFLQSRNVLSPENVPFSLLKLTSLIRTVQMTVLVYPIFLDSKRTMLAKNFTNPSSVVLAS